MRAPEINNLADQMIVNIDTTIGQLMRLRNEVEAIKTDCSKLQAMAGVSTQALGNGNKDAAIALVLNNRAKSITKKSA